MDPHRPILVAMACTLACAGTPNDGGEGSAGPLPGTTTDAPTSATPDPATSRAADEPPDPGAGATSSEDGGGDPPGGGSTREGGSESGDVACVDADAFGIRKVYGDLEAECAEPECVRYAGLDGRDVHDDVENLPRYDGEGDHPLQSLGDDVWGVALDWSTSGQMQARLELWSVDDDPWVTMEVTAFVKVVENHGNAAIQPYVYGGSHTNTGNRCYGGAYKPKFRLSGDATVQKELCHGPAPDSYSSPHGPVESAWQFEESRWYGFKSVAYPVDQGVRIEMYFLQNDLGVGAKPDLPTPCDQQWVLLTSATDDGWTIGSDYCEVTCGTVDGTIFSSGNPVAEQESQSEIRHTGANVGALRLDDVVAHLWGYSVRRVDPSDPRLP